MRKRFFRDRDFIRTTEDFLFCVVGPYHPEDRVIAYLKYIPAEGGQWIKGKTQYRRMMPRYTIPALIETFKFITMDHAHYLYNSPAYNIVVTAVPRDYIQQHYMCEVKLSELLQRQPELDPLEKKVSRLVALLSTQSGVLPTSFGVTGSILLEIHNPAFSDIDLIVYGWKESVALKRSMLEAFISEDAGFRPFQAEEQQRWIAHKVLNHPIDPIEAGELFQRKWNMGIFEGTLFSVHPVKVEDEVTERYGDKRFTALGRVTLQALVTESHDSLFLPGSYKIADAKINGKTADTIQEVVTYESLYCDIAEPGERIQVVGKLEHVIDSRSGREYDRVLVGSTQGRGKDSVLPIVS